MIKIKRLLQTLPLIALLTAGAQRAAAADITFGVDDQTIPPGGTVTVPVVVQNYTAAGFQFTFNWDPAVLEFSNFQNQRLRNLNSVDLSDPFNPVIEFNTSLFNVTADQGRFTVVYDSGNGVDETVEDGTGIFEIVFNVLGAEGTSSALTFTDAPTQRVVASQSGPETFITDNGSIVIANPPSISHQIAAQTTAEDTNLGGLALTVSDQETDDGQLVLSFTESANPGLIDTINFTNNGGAVTAEIVPAPNATGDTEVTISVTDAAGGRTAATPFALTITSVNDNPVAGADSGVGFITDEDTAFTTASGLLNDSDVDAGDTLSITAVGATTVAGTSVSVNPDGTFTYDPNGQFENLAPGASATDTFEYTLSDGNGGSATGTVEITIEGVNDAAVAVDDSGDDFTTDEDTAFITANVVANDTDVDGDPLSVVAGSLDLTGTQGLVQSNMDGTFSYDPNGVFESLKPGESATDTFTYQVSDGIGAASTATVSITINGANDAPVAEDDPALPLDPGFVTDEDTAFSTASVLINDTDVDQDTLTVTLLDTTNTKGSVTIGANGAIDYDPNGQFEALGVADSDTDTFTYTVDDGAQGTDAAEVTLTINGVNDDPTAVADSGEFFTTDEDSAFTTGSVLPNDSDPDANDVLGVEAGSLDTTGTLGLVVDNGDGTFDYNPNGAFEDLDDGESGDDSFAYTVFDGNGGTSTTTVTITVNGVNDGPVATDDPFIVVKNTIDNPLAVLANDTDTDGDTLTVTAVQSPGSQGGTVTINGANDGLVYTPAQDVVDVDETFTYTVSDGDLTSTATVTVSLISNPSPIAVNDGFTGIAEDAAASTFDVLDNDSDPEDEPIQVTDVQNPSNEGGVVTITGGGAGVSYTPAANFNGGDSFTYTISDGISTATATVNVTVDPVDDTPTITDVTDQTIDENIALQPSSASVTFTVEDVETDPLALTVTATSDNQSLLPDAGLNPVRDANPAGQAIGFTLDLTPVEDQAGTATVTLTVNDGSLSATDTFDLVVNDLAPVTGASHDGLLDGATVFFDEDFSGSVNGVEPSVVTDDVGNFNLIVPIAPFDDDSSGQLDPNEGRLVATGGRDIATGLDNQVGLSAPVGSTVVNALTTVIQRLIERGAASPAAAETQLKAALSIPNGVSLTSANLFVAASNGNADAAAALLTGAQVWDTVLMISALVAGDLGQTVAQTFGATFDELVTDVRSGTAIDFTSTTYLASLLADVQAALGSNLTADEQSGAVAILANVNQLKQNQAGQAPATIAANVSQVQTIAQSSVSQDLQNLGSGGADLEDTVFANTADNLTAQVAVAPIGDIDGSANAAGTIEFEKTTARYLEDGTPIDPIVVRRTGGNIGDIAFTVTSTGVGTATIGQDYAGGVANTFLDRQVRWEAPLTNLLLDDALPESEETVEYELQPAQGVQLGAQSKVTVTIVDNDSAGTFQFSAPKYAEFEATAAQTRNVTILRTDGAQGAVDLLVTPSIEAGDTAVAADLTSFNPITVSFADGALRRTIALPVVEDIFVEGHDTFTMTLTAAPGAPGSTTIGGLSTSEYTITNDDFNTAPTLAAIGPRSINEDGALSIQIGTTDLENDVLTVTLASSDQALLPDANLNIAPNGDASAARTLTATPVANGFGTADITVTLSDGQLQDTETFTLTVNPVNDAPVLAAIPNRSFIQEGLLTVTVPLRFTDPDFIDQATTPMTFELSSSNAALLPRNRMSVSGDGVQRELNLSPVAGVEGTTTVSVTVFDGEFRSTRTFNIEFGTPNQAPTITAIGDEQVDEDGSVSVGFTVADDKTAVDALAVTAVSSNVALVAPGNLVLSGAGAQRSLAITPVANQSGTTTVTVSVQDADGATTTEAFTVTVNAVNDRPTIQIAGFEVTIPGDGSGTVNFTVGDIDSAVDALVVTGVGSDAALFPASSFAFSGTGANRSVTITPAEDRNGGGLINLRVSDGDRSAVASILVFVEASIVPPTINGLANISIDEDSVGSDAFTIGDENSPIESLSVSAVSLNTDVLPDSGIEITGTGANRGIRVTPLADQSGIAQVQVTVSDGEFESAQTIAVTVNEVPDAPTISAIADATVDAGTSAIRDFTIADVDSSLDALVVTAVSSNEALIGGPGLTITGTGAQRRVRAVAFLNQLGSTTLTVTVSDGAQSASASFEVTVQEPNEVPTIVAADRSLSGFVGEAVETTVTIADADDDLGALTVTAVSSAQGILPNSAVVVSGSGASRTISATASRVGDATITVTVTDGKGSASTTVAVSVRPSVSIQLIGANVQVSWSGGFLEFADSPFGPWTRFTPQLPGPANLSFPISEGQRYFRSVLE